MQPGNAAEATLFIADDPASARETALEIVVQGEGEPPAIAANGRSLDGLAITRGSSTLTLTLVSAALKDALARGVNVFRVTSPTKATLTSLSVRVAP